MRSNDDDGSGADLRLELEECLTAAAAPQRPRKPHPPAVAVPLHVGVEVAPSGSRVSRRETLSWAVRMARGHRGPAMLNEHGGEATRTVTVLGRVRLVTLAWDDEGVERVVRMRLVSVLVEGESVARDVAVERLWLFGGE